MYAPPIASILPALRGGTLAASFLPRLSTAKSCLRLPCRSASEPTRRNPNPNFNTTACVWGATTPDPMMMNRLRVDRGAIKFVLNGADIMCPGLTSPGATIHDEVEEGTPVVSVSPSRSPLDVNARLLVPARGMPPSRVPCARAAAAPTRCQRLCDGGRSAGNLRRGQGARGSAGGDHDVDNGHVRPSSL